MEELRNKNKFRLVISYYQISISMPLSGSSIVPIPGDIYQAKLHLKNSLEKYEHKHNSSIKAIDLELLQRVVDLAITCDAIAISNLTVIRNGYGRNSLSLYVSFENIKNPQDFELQVKSFDF